MRSNLAQFGSSFFENTGIQLVTLAVVCFYAFFFNLGAHDVDLMEARNFVTAREMVEKGNWLTPTMNGELRITKPPLPTWITALVRTAGGNVDNNVILRLPSAMAASLMVLSLFGFMRVLTNDRLLPLISAVILATSLLVIDMGRRNTWDIYCHSFMLMAMWAFSHGWKKTGTSFGTFTMGGCLLAASFMSKGPISFYTLLLPCIIAYLWPSGFQSVWGKRKELALAILVFAIISSIWPFLIHIIHPKAAETVINTELSSWATRHVRPFYFYAHFPLYTGVWAVIVIAGLLKPYAKIHINHFGSYYYILVWVALSILLLSIIPEKKERYLLPAMIPMAVMAGYLFRSLFQSYKDGVSTIGDNRLVTAHMLVACTASLCIPFLLYYFGVKKYLKTPAAVIGWSIVFFLMAGSIIYSGKAKKIGWLFIHTVMLICLVNISLLPVIYLSPMYRKNQAYQSLRSVRNIQELKGLEYYTLGPVSIPQVWDIGKIVKTLPNTKKSFPYGKLPIALFSDTDPTHIKDELQLESVDVQIIGKYKADPRNPKRIKYVSIINRATSNID
jgi:4-amino-4-deoxy-L-arabinose transferase-like glycosyltransferase